jgi:protein associated with RNAse G/E
MSVANWRSIKFDGSLNRSVRTSVLGETGEGRWIFAAEGTHVERPDRRGYSHPCDAIMLLPFDGMWHATWLRGWDPRLYVDVALPVDDDSNGAMVFIDLDLDVVRHVDGEVEVLDRDEFEANIAQMGYPETLVERANATVVWLEHALRSGVEPFLPIPLIPPAWRHLTAEGF